MSNIASHATMFVSEQRTGMIELFQAAGKAHCQAFVAGDGEDAEWPMWYAEYLQVPVLSVRSSTGSERWIPNSRDIVRYLESTLG